MPSSDAPCDLQSGSSAVPCCGDTDDALVARFRSGDVSAFDSLVELHQARVTRLAHRLCGWSGDVEDLVQDVFLRVLQKLDTYRGASRFSTWLNRITVNRCRSHQRWQRLRARHLARLWKRSAAANHAGWRGQARGDDELVRDAVRRLPFKYREPVVLRYFEQMSVREIGEVLDITEAAVETRLHRARKRLKKTLAERKEG